MEEYVSFPRWPYICNHVKMNGCDKLIGAFYLHVRQEVGWIPGKSLPTMEPGQLYPYLVGPPTYYVQ